MSSEPHPIPPPRRQAATDRLRLRPRRRLTAPGAVALVDAVADALQNGHVGAAGDLLGIVVRESAADDIVAILLGLDAVEGAAGGARP